MTHSYVRRLVTVLRAQHHDTEIYWDKVGKPV